MPQLADLMAVKGYSLFARRLFEFYWNASWFKFENSLTAFERQSMGITINGVELFSHYFHRFSRENVFYAKYLAETQNKKS